MKGYPWLKNLAFVEGVFYGLKQALYSAIFGAGLGYARLAQHRWQRWAVPLAAFGLAVAAHALHSYALRTTTGLNLATIVLTWARVLAMLAVMVWSLRRQRQCLATELVGEVPDEVLYSVISWRGRLRAQWRALWRSGLRGLAWVRRLHQQCAKLAFKKMQRRELRALVEMG